MAEGNASAATAPVWIFVLTTSPSISVASLFLQTGTIHSRATKDVLNRLNTDLSNCYTNNSGDKEASLVYLGGLVLWVSMPFHPARPFLTTILCIFQIKFAF